MILIFFQGFKKAPLSLILFFLFSFIFLYNFSDIQRLHKKSTEVFFTEHFVETHIQIYSRFIFENQGAYSYEKRDLASKALKSHRKSQYEVLRLSLKDSLFLENKKDINYENHLGYLLWKKMKIREQSPLVKWGLSVQNSDTLRRFSYQFFHMDVSHFLVNMFFFLLFAPLLERIMGSFLFLSFYLFSGFFSSFFYDYFNGGLSLAPLIGASGALNAVLAFLCVYYGFKPVRYFWFVFPKKGFMGFVYLPALWALFFWCLKDLTGFLYMKEASVAYSSHLGGQILGALLALVFRFSHKLKGIYYEKGFKNKPIGYKEFI